MITLRNEQITVMVAEQGAELQSIKDANGREYLWQAGPEWPRRSPILFPIVCSVENDTYYVDGQPYHLPRHGFARDMAFTVVSQSETKVTLALHESEETLKVYPYRFNLGVSYRIEGSEVHVIWHVENTDNRDIHFQIGGHPAFNVPGMKPGDPLKGTIKIDNEGQLKALRSHSDGSVEMTEMTMDDVEAGYIEFDDAFFSHDSVKLHGSQTREAALLDTDGSPAVTVSYKCPIIAFWSPFQKQAPFVCIEPWYGLGDPRGYQGEFKDKPYMNHLQPGASFMSKYKIGVNPKQMRNVK